MRLICPVHDRVVAAHPSGKLISFCDGCAQEAAQAQRDIEDGVARAQWWATQVLAKHRRVS